MLLLIISVLVIAMVLSLTRALMGPGFFDRVLAANSFGTLIVLFIGAYGFVTGRPDFLDLSLIYALINYIGTVAILKFFEKRDSQSVTYQEDDL